MHIYYINIARRTDRRAFMENQFARLGLGAQRIEGVTPDGVEAAMLARHCDPADWRAIPPAALCCRLSHLRAARALLESEASHGAIFEDDAVLSERLPSFLSAFSANPEGTGVLRLETYFEGLRYKLAERTLGGIAVVRPFSWEPGAAGYVLSRRAAEILVDLPIGGRRNDHVLFNPFGPLARRVALRQVTPALCVQSHHAGLGTPDLGSDNTASPARSDEHEWTWQETLRRARTFVRRELIFGPQKLAHQLRGARKHHIPFAPQ